MHVTTRPVIGGEIACEGVALAEGSVVIVPTHAPDEAFTLSPREAEELAAAMAEVKRGHFVTPQELLANLRPFG